MYESEIFEKDSAEKKGYLPLNMNMCAKAKRRNQNNIFCLLAFLVFMTMKKKSFITFEKLTVLNVVIKVFCEKI